MKALRISAAIAAAAAILLGGAWAGGALAQRAPPQIATARYPGTADVVRVGEALTVAGQPMQLSLFRTADAPAKIVRFYADAFRARGLPPVMASETSLAHVAAFDPLDGLQRFISAVQAPDGATLVMLGATNPRVPPRLLQGGETAAFPVPSGHRGFLGFRSTDAGSTAESAQFVTSLPRAKVASFYRTTLAARGYEEASNGPDDAVLTFLKPRSTISVAMQGLGEPSATAVFVTQTESDPQ
jgi:hypothetical protein